MCVGHLEIVSKTSTNIHAFLKLIFSIHILLPNLPVSIVDFTSFLCLALAAGPSPICLGPIKSPRPKDFTRWSWSATAVKAVLPSYKERKKKFCEDAILWFSNIKITKGKKASKFNLFRTERPLKCFNSTFCF